MTADEKNRFDVIAILRREAWENFNRRRNFEWRVCTALWAVLATPSVIFVSGRMELEFKGTSVAVAMTLAAIFIAALHLLFIRGLNKANRLDRKIANHYESEMRKAANPGFPEDLARELDNLQSRTGPLSNSSQVLQVGVTVLLGISAIMAAWSANIG